MPRLLPPLAALLLSLAAPGGWPKPAPMPPETSAFIDEMVTEHGFELPGFNE